MKSVDSTKSILMTIVVLGFVLGFCMAALGAYLAYTGSVAKTEFSFFGQTFKSSNVGIAAIFIGAAIIVLLGGRVLKTVDRKEAVKPPISTTEDISRDTSVDKLQTKARIIIKLSDDLQNKRIRFGLLHVRNGKDEVQDSGPLLNEVIYFQRIDRVGNMEAIVTYTKKIGFQFKCFVDYKGVDYSLIKDLLEASGFSDISKGRGKPFRAWFIIPAYAKYTTVDGIVNNYYYPS